MTCTLTPPQGSTWTRTVTVAGRVGDGGRGAGGSYTEYPERARFHQRYDVSGRVSSYVSFAKGFKVRPFIGFPRFFNNSTLIDDQVSEVEPEVGGSEADPEGGARGGTEAEVCGRGISHCSHLSSAGWLRNVHALQFQPPASSSASVRLCIIQEAHVDTRYERIAVE